MELKDKTILITSIGDFIGLRAAEIAIAKGMKVRGLEPLSEKAKPVEALGIPVVIGSITEPEAVEKACQDTDIIFHTESVIDPGGAIEHFRQVNVDGAVNLAKTARQAGVKSFIHLSSVLVYGFKFPDRITEDGPFRGEKNPYCQTKIEAEQELLKLNDPPDFGVIILRAGDVYGPGASSWIVQPLELMQQQHFTLANGGRGIINHVYVDNLTEAVFLAAQKESYGQAFNITDGSKTTCREFYDRLAELAGESKPKSMPAIALKALAHTKGKEVGIFPESIDFFTRSHTYSIEKANRVLGYQPRVNLDEGMVKTADWLRDRNYLKGNGERRH
jgi:nucleoside-diphosphate-sugar epimerase